MSEYKYLVGEAYGDTHANLEFREGKYLVQADSVTSILQGDLIQAKLNQPLVGLRCINRNKQTKQEFKDAITKVYKLIASQEKNQTDVAVEHIQTFEELLEEYSMLTTNYKEVGLEEKIAILLKKINSIKMASVDSLSYALQLRKTLFNVEERNNNVGITIIRNNKPTDANRLAMASAIITLNESNFVETPNENIYYYFTGNDELLQISLEQLQTMFDDGVFEYIESDDPKIPGLAENGGAR